MKQTQTKLFDFSDVGLDFCAGSKNLFPDRFKKMLSLGYNVQTVSSVAVAGNQVTFTYGGAHGYVADRVLKADSGPLSLINEGEFWIDSVTMNTVTFTLDDALISISGGFTTRIASLGYELIYELDAVHIYKFKALDDTDLFLRLCFQTAAASRNKVQPCIGKSINIETGEITDRYALNTTSKLITPDSSFAWPFADTTFSTHNNYSYAQGYSNYGKGMVVGSLYHLLFLFSISSGQYGHYFNGFLPTACLDYDSLKLPLMIGFNGESGWQQGQDNSSGGGAAYIGNNQVNFIGNGLQQHLFSKPVKSSSSYLSGGIDTFNTTVAEPIRIYERSTEQFIGFAYGALLCGYTGASSSRPATGLGNMPNRTKEIDFNSDVIIHAVSNNSPQYAFLAIPIEEIKIA